jgi:hypothetical protein
LAACLILGLTIGVGVAPSGAANTRTSADSTTARTDLTLNQWKQRYERDIGIIASDVLVVVDDGKRAQTHDTTAKVRTTLKDCRQWGRDASIARTAAPPIPMAAAERAWTSMMRSSARAAAQCVAVLQTGSTNGAKSFRKQLVIVEKDEATLVKLLNG